MRSRGCFGGSWSALAGQGVAKLVLVDGGLDVRAEVLDSLRPAINRLGVEFPSLDMFMGFHAAALPAPVPHCTQQSRVTWLTAVFARI